MLRRQQHTAGKQEAAGDDAGGQPAARPGCGGLAVQRGWLCGRLCCRAIRSESNHVTSPLRLSPSLMRDTVSWLLRPSSSLSPQSCVRKTWKLRRGRGMRMMRGESAVS